MNVGKKLNIAFYSVIGLMCLSVIITFLNLMNIGKKSDEALTSRVQQVQIVEQIRANMYRQGMFARSLVLNNTEANNKGLTEAAKDVDDGVETLKSYLKKDGLEQTWKSLNDNNNLFNQQMEQLITAVNDKQELKAKSLINYDLTRSNDALLKVADDIIAHQNKALKTISKETDAAIALTKTISLIALILSIIIGVIVIFFVKRTITNPLVAVTEAVNVVASGDLSQPNMNYESKDEIGQLTTGVNTMKDSLRNLIQNIQRNAEHLSSSAEQLSASTQQVTATNEDISSQVTQASQMTTGSSTAAKESANAMDETAHGVQRIAEAVQTLNHASSDASHLSNSGVDIVDKAKSQMEVINESTGLVNELVEKLAKQTEEIASITGVITDITDQTNLLALNASIEAARAGEHGKGFAVVAEEVSKLAEQSKQSANLITSLTQEIKADTENVEQAVVNSLHSVKDGVEIITKAGASFNDISTSIDMITAQIQEVSATTEEISAGAEEVSASVHEISTGSEQAANNIEVIVNAMGEQVLTMGQVSEVAQDLNLNAQRLQEEVAKFKI